MNATRTIVLLSIIGLLVSGAPALGQSSEVNKEALRRINQEAWGQGRLAVVDELVAPDYVYHEAALGEIHGPEGLKQAIMVFRTAYPDLQFIIEDMIAEGDLVAVRWSTSSTHQGELMGIPATGLKTTTLGINIARFGADGRVVEEWSSWDVMGLMQQLGVVAPPRSGAEAYIWGADSDVTGDAGDPALNRLLVTRIVSQFWNGKDIAGLLETHSTEAIAHNPVIPASPLDFHAYRQACLEQLVAFPNLHVATDALIAEADKVVIRWTVTGTQSGALMGMPASGRAVEFKGVTIYRLADGKVVETWWAYDALGMVEQITSPPEYSLEGAWITNVPTPMGNLIFAGSWRAQDRAGTMFTAEMEHVNTYPLLSDLYPEVDASKFSSVLGVKVGRNTYEMTGLEYHTKTVAPGHTEIVGIAVVRGTFEQVGPDLIQGQGTGAYYLASQDADQDGFPDEGQEPMVCVPWEWTTKRVTMMPGCVPTPMP